ncbi:hypothetical protein ACLB2K_071103 [Fragaria x ananassa]
MSNSHHAPMLLFPAEEEDTWNLYNIMEKKVLGMQVTVPPNYKRFCGSSKGWLIALDENFVVTLINPFSRVKGRRAKENSIIRLPPLDFNLSTIRSWRKLYQHYLTRATISADPILYPDDCIVAIVFEEAYELAFLRLKKDTSWTYITGEISLKVYQIIHDVVHIENKFYALNRWDKLLSFDITDEFHPDAKLVTCGGARGKSVSNRYLVYSEDKRELLVVHSYIIYEDGCEKRWTRRFRVFGLDLEKFKWIKKKNCLGGLSIFLGDNSSIAVLASKFPGCKPDRIYFNHEIDRLRNDEVSPHDFGVYNFKTKMFEKGYSKRVKTQLRRSKRYPIWIVPTFHL